MKVFIQDVATNEYFQGPFKWVKDVCAAYDFGSSLEAFDFCAQMHDRTARILLSFDDPQRGVCLFYSPDQKVSQPA